MTDSNSEYDTEPDDELSSMRVTISEDRGGSDDSERPSKSSGHKE